MKPRLRWIFAILLLAGTLWIVLGWVRGLRDGMPSLATAAAVAAHGSQSEPAPSKPPASPGVSSAPSTGVAAPRVDVLSVQFIAEDAGAERALEVALDEMVYRDPDGREQSLPIAAGDVAGVRAVAAQYQVAPGGEVFPVAYERGVDRTLANRRLITREIRVEVGPDFTGEGIEGLVSVERPDYAPGFAVLRMTDAFTAMERVNRIRELPGVKRADVLLARQQTRRALPNDPLIGNQWHLKNTGQGGGTAGTDVDVEPVWNYPGTGYRGAGIVVGVVDDGLETGHPDLAANVRTDIDYDWNDGTPNDPSPGTGDDHGTACAGNVAAIGNNSLGVSGSAPEAKIVGLRLIAASTTDAQEAEAMAHRNDVIQIKSNSWGPSDTGTTLEGPGALTRAALQTAATTGRGGLGTISLWAGGNGRAEGDNSNYDGYANSIYTIAVAALTNTRQQASYSESGANIVVTSPSSGGTLDITTVDRSGANGYNSSSGAAGNYANDFGGTSSATPTAAGVVALMLQRRPGLGWRDVQEILIRSAFRVNPADADWTTNGAGLAFNHKFGAGLVDANAAVTLAANWTNLAAQTSVASTQTGLAASIPNNNATGTTRTFDLGASNLRVEHVTVRVSINHTARGNLAITLTSPSGTASRLAEVRSDANDNYSDWTFMTVRNWGESSRGTWTLRVADQSNTGNSTGGTLTAAEIVVFGSPAVPVNPPPVVQLTAPADQGVFSVDAPVSLAATASDATVNGSAGIVTQVEFLSGDTVVGTDATAPYAATWTPPSAGSYTLRARATDSEGAAATSGSVTITVANQPPVVTTATVSPSSRAFSDESLQTNVTAVDPEGAAVSLTYRWQSSPDGVNFTDASGQIGATLPATAGNAGRVWRCVVTPSDGVNSGAPFTTAGTMVITRPATTAMPGSAYSYTSDLVLRGTATTFTRAAIINEFSQGSGTSEWVEILTLRAGSFRGWKFDDASNDATAVTFANTGVWDNIPAGTLIVIYPGGSKDARLPADDLDAADGRLVIPSNNATFFSGGWPALGNSGDGLLLRNAGGTSVHQVSYGNNSSLPPNIGNVGSGTAAAFTGDTEDVAATAAGWRTNASTVLGSATVAGVTPGAGNTTVNADFAANLQSGYFNQPSLFRLGANSQTPPGLSLDPATGLLAGTLPTTPGEYPIVVERFNALGEVVSYAFTLSVAPPPTPTPTPTPPPTPGPTPDPTPTSTPSGIPAPSLKITSKLRVANGTAVVVRGSAKGAGLIRITFANRKFAKIVRVNSTRLFVARVKLYPGRNTITARARDGFGNTSAVARFTVLGP